METNYISCLGEKCQKHKLSYPTYTEDNDGSKSGQFKSICSYKDWSVTGSGQSKKCAKQDAARLMMKKMTEEHVFKEISKPVQDSVVSKINEYCSIKKKSLPVYSEKDREGGLFVIECNFDGFCSLGKGESKKIAKEKAAYEVASHFDIHKFYDEHRKLKEKPSVTKNSVQILNEYCQKLSVGVCYSEKRSSDKFVVQCNVAEFLVDSEACFSKKLAKYNAATKMLELLREKNFFLNTPSSSPSRILSAVSMLTPQPKLSHDLPQDSSSTQPTSVSKDESTSGTKRPFLPSFLSDDDDDDDAPLIKRSTRNNTAS